MDDRPLTGEQVEEIIARALELDRSGPTTGMNDLRAIAREIDVSPGALEQAAQEVLARSEPPRAVTGGGGGVLAPFLETLAAVVGGGFAGGVAGAGFPIVAITILLLVLVGLASRRDWRTIARLMTQWVLLCGVFGFTSTLLVSGIPASSLGALFAGGALMAAVIVWLQERGLAPPDGGPPLLPGGASDRS